MGRHVGAFGHKAHVTQGAGVHHRPKSFARHRIELAGVRVVYEIKKARKAVAQIETAATTMTDVEHAPQLSVNLVRVGELRFSPGQSMAGRSLKTAFTHERTSMW
jgi:hypothetical protein